MKTETFFTLPDGSVARLYTLSNTKGMTAKISDFGGVVYSLTVPDKKGKATDVVLGYAKPEDYMRNSPHFGVMVGRVANRIKDATFCLDGSEYKLSPNDFGHSLHGGAGFGYSHRMWEATAHSENSLTLELFSPDGDGGYPGNLKVCVVYTVTDDNSLEIEMRGVTDSATVINLTNHSYFNLSGENTLSLRDHELSVAAELRQEVDEELIPTGKLCPVRNTPYDLRKFKAFPLILEKLPKGLDTSYYFPDDYSELRSLAAARSLSSGIRMDVYSTDYSIQVYTGGGLQNVDMGKCGHTYPPFSGVCFESQHLVDSPNNPDFPSIRLESGEAYYQKTCYIFSVEK